MTTTAPTYPWADKWGQEFKDWYAGASQEDRDAYKQFQRDAIFQSIRDPTLMPNLRWAESYDAAHNPNPIAAELRAIVATLSILAVPIGNVGPLHDICQRITALAARLDGKEE